MGVPGYTLKGIERNISKRRLTKLAAEVMLIRARRGIQEYKAASEAEKDDVVKRWRMMHS